jgi:hypothetical protein
VLASACAQGRSQAQLNATTFGSMATPAGSKLVEERYQRAQWNIEGPNCAALTRTYISTDVSAFLTAYRDLAMTRGARPIGQIPASPLFSEPRRGYAPAAQVEIDGTTVMVWFYDGRDPAETYPWPASALKQDWPYLAILRIHDNYSGSGGGCS